MDVLGEDGADSVFRASPKSASRQLLFRRLVEKPFGWQAFIADLQAVEEPFRVALENVGQLCTNVAAWLTESIDDPAQVRFIDAQHSREPVLTNAGCVNAQFQVGIDLSAEAHVGSPSSMCLNDVITFVVINNKFLLWRSAIGVPNRKRGFWQHLVDLCGERPWINC